MSQSMPQNNFGLIEPWKQNDFQELLSRRRACKNVVERKALSKQIRKVLRTYQRQEQATKLNMILEEFCELGGMEATFHCPISSMQVDKGGMTSTQDFTNNLSDIFKSDRPPPLTMPSALQTAAPISNIPPFDLRELRKALRSMRSRKASDESGLVAEMFKHGS